nr:MAG TPA: hypothetical protein [Caudoviricetes sp.]DAZ33233.1 MAG TPA: hypothetical protein [Caudoviricetes sp.]
MSILLGNLVYILNNICKNNKLLTLLFKVVVHISSLLLMQFSYELLILSYKHRLYLILRLYPLRSTHFHYLSLVVYFPQEE